MESKVICVSIIEEEQLEELGQSPRDDFSDNKHITQEIIRTQFSPSKCIPVSKDKRCRQSPDNNKKLRYLPKSSNDIAPSFTYIPVSDNNHLPIKMDEDDKHSECHVSDPIYVHLNDGNDDNDINAGNDFNFVNCEIQHDRHTCCEACRATQRLIMKKLDFIIRFLENKDAVCTNIESNTNLLPAFPLTTIENFFKFEEELQQDREIRKQLKNKIAKIGGKNYTNKIRNILRFIMHDSIAKKISWTGQKQSMAIKNTLFANIIIDYIVSIDNCSLYEAQKVIQEWLRHAGDRLNYLLKK